MDMGGDAHGTYLMNSKDLCALPVLKKLMEIGVDSLKIEGRSRSAFYTGAVTRAYRLAIDALASGKGVPDLSYEIVNSLPSRGYTTALLEPGRPDATQDYLQNSPYPGRWRICGGISAQDPDGTLHITVKNRFGGGKDVLLFTPEGIKRLRTDHMRDANTGEIVADAPGAGYFVTLPCPYQIDPEVCTLLSEEI